MKHINARVAIAFFFIVICLAYLFPGDGLCQPCAHWAGKIVSLQGVAQVRKAGETKWRQVRLNDAYCPGDTIRVLKNSRAAIVLKNETFFRIDQNTTITFTGVEKEETILLHILRGVTNFFSRVPRRLKIATPFVNGAVEGTEFYIRVEKDETFLSIFEGRVAVANKAGSLILASGQSAVARAAQAPVLRTVVKPRDAVQWALYYPPVIDWRPKDFSGTRETGWRAMLRRSIAYYWKGDMARAFSELSKAPERIRDPRFYLYRAALFLTVGRIEAARSDIARALKLDPSSSYALALQSIIAVVQNNREKALELATKAVELDSKSATARVALSYAQQAHFHIKGALKSLQKAVELDSGNALAWSRLADLFLSVGYLDKAAQAAHKAVDLNPHLAHTQTVLGFTYLNRTEIEDAKEAFNKAIELDSAAPLPRFGLGLAKIRGGDLKDGSAEIEIAAVLDPNNSLIRSYLGKAFYEEKRDKLAKDQYEIAKKLDPLDPTPWFYDAIRKQTINRPVEALQDMQKSIELNDNRGVYRSRLLLDEDLAARSASLGRIYNDLGFQQLGLVEGWNSVNTAPDNYSAHRLLADLYSSLPRHEIARTSELLQSQLLQPINITPVQPQLAESNLFILDGAGPSDPSFNEFNPLFLSNRFALQASGVAGGNGTYGDDLVQSGVWNKFSYSVGQFHYQTDGFRENNDQEQNILNAFAQMSLSPSTSIMGEIRSKNSDFGDLELLFDPKRYSEKQRQDLKKKTYRLGFHHSFTPNSEVVATVIGQDIDETVHDENVVGKTDIVQDTKGYLGEAQHLFRAKGFNITSGLGFYDADYKETFKFKSAVPFIPDMSSKKDEDIRHANMYIYSQIKLLDNLTFTTGLSLDSFDADRTDSDQVNPKLGLSWNPFPLTTFRFALYRVLTRTLISDQTLEPTQVAGFNQFFDDVPGTDIWVFGGAIDQKLSGSLFGGAEFYKRKLEIPYEHFDLLTSTSEFRDTGWNEYIGRAYIYWAPHPWLATSAEYFYETFDRGEEYPGTEEIADLKTNRLLFAGKFFHPSGFIAGMKVSYVDQSGEFGNPMSPPTVHDDDQFWVVDATVGYRLPKRFGFLTFEVRNLFNEDFKFQDTDPANPTILPGRLFLGRFTLAF
jgi:tetratricopeptide (TPR) repeat protein